MTEDTTNRDDLTIPSFLLRDPGDIKPLPVRRSRAQRIAYPKDGYKCKGFRAAARARHKERLRRRAERMRDPKFRRLG